MVKETNLQSREAKLWFPSTFFFSFFFPLCDKTIAAVRPHMCRVLICALWFASSSSLIGVVLFTLPVRQCFQRAIAFNCDVPSYSVSAPQRHRSVINNERVTVLRQQDVADMIKIRARFSKLQAFFCSFKCFYVVFESTVVFVSNKKKLLLVIIPLGLSVTSQTWVFLKAPPTRLR